MRLSPVQEDGDSGRVRHVSQGPVLGVPLQVLGGGLEEAVVIRVQAACRANSPSRLEDTPCSP